MLLLALVLLSLVRQWWLEVALLWAAVLGGAVAEVAVEQSAAEEVRWLWVAAQVLGDPSP